MAETFLQPIALGICSLRIDLSNTNLFLSWREIVKGGYEGAVDIDLKGKNDKNGRNCREP